MPQFPPFPGDPAYRGGQDPGRGWHGDWPGHGDGYPGAGGGWAGYDAAYDGGHAANGHAGYGAGGPGSGGYGPHAPHGGNGHGGNGHGADGRWAGGGYAAPGQAAAVGARGYEGGYRGYDEGYGPPYAGAPYAGPAGVPGAVPGMGTGSPDGDIGRGFGYRGTRSGGLRGLLAPGRLPGRRPAGPRGPAGPGARRRGSWWRQWSLRKAGLVTGGAALGMALIMIAGFFYVYGTVQIPPKLLSTEFPQESTVYFANGQPVGCFCTVNRQTMTQAQVMRSKYLVDAVVAAEDRNFFHEGGISITGLLRAVKNDLFGSGVQGGSTITEEYVKSVIDPSYLGNLTYTEKVKEIVIAIKLAKKESKWWVMTQYLNSIYFGATAWGAETAAETYFGVHAWQLTVAQAAMLAAMIQSPSGYDPLHPNQVVPGLGSLAWRWRNEVLANMVRDGAITQATADAQRFPKVTLRQPNMAWNGYRGYIMTLVQNELEYYYHIQPSQIGSLGLQIHTSISRRLMNGLVAAVNASKAQMRSDGYPLPWYVHIGAVLEKPGTGQIVAFYAGPSYTARHCQKIACQNLNILSSAPVGSSFKPYVLATAVSQGMNAQTSILNTHSPLCIPPADDTEALRLQLSKQTMKCPTNLGYYLLVEPSENTPGRNLTVPYATAQSNNAAYEDLIHRTGVNNVIEMAQRLGVSPATIAGLKQLFWSPTGKYPGAVIAALGAGSMTPVDQANTFATLVSGGISATPHVINYVVEDGRRLPSPVVVNRVLPEAVAADTDYALSFDTNPAYGGTGVPNAVWNRPMIAKTGTLGQTVHSSAAWFIGAIPQYSLSVGMFTDHPSTQFLDGLPNIGGYFGGGYGGAWPAHIWRTFMGNEFNSLPVRPLPTPNFNPPQFVKWIQAPPIKAKPKRRKCRPGPPFGRGHKHGHGPFGPGPCPSGSPSPSPSPSGSPSPSPSPSPGGPTPNPTGSGPPFPGQRLPASSGSGRAPAPGPALVVAAGLTAVATLPRRLRRRRVG